jgi:Pyruvate/2-oxoacid:ferredoxin oxidoreductase delta subunit
MIEQEFGEQQIPKQQPENRAQGAIAGADPWVHRSEGMRCKTCIWFVPKQANNKIGYDIGRCRRHAPTMGGYPVVFVNDWCGDHRLDENKV